jgi:hypothetical protein
MFGGDKAVNPEHRVFEFSRYSSTRDLKQWLRRTEKAASHVRKQDTKFESLEQTAEIIVNDFGYMPLSEYKQSSISKPPCSIIQAGNGGPLNCVGRASTVALISKLKKFEKNPNQRMGVEIKVDWEKGENGRYVENGHVVVYISGEKGKNYLAEPGNYRSTEDHSLEILPAAYAIQNAIALEVEGKQSEAKKLAREGIKDCIKYSKRDSPYLNYVSNKIIDK